MFGKTTKVSFKTAIHQTKQTLDYVHSDLWEPSRVPLHGGAKYFLSIIDDYSRKVWIYIRIKVILLLSSENRKTSRKQSR